MNKGLKAIFHSRNFIIFHTQKYCLTPVNKLMPIVVDKNEVSQDKSHDAYDMQFPHLPATI